MMTKEELIDGIIEKLVRLGYVNIEKLETIQTLSHAYTRENQDKDKAPEVPPSSTD